MWKCLTTVCLLTVAVGCGGYGDKMKANSVPTESWAELDAIDQTLMGAGMALEMGDKTAAKQFDAKAFKTALDALTASTAQRLELERR